MAPKIPDRWIPYTACGDVIEGTRIICFKVPLAKNVQTSPEITKIWDIPALLAEIPKLGAVIDLTNTARYYNPREFEAAGVRHRKILMPGREIPSESKVEGFMNAVDEFLGKDCDSLIGIHCTHGLNRTGYMVCRYMRDRLRIPAEEAIKRFEKARGYEIEREIYLASLLGRALPSPDFDSNDSQRRDDHESQRRRKRGHQSGNSNVSQIRNNDRQSDDKKKALTRNRKKQLRRKKKKQENEANYQESRVRTKKRKIYHYQ